MTTDDAVAVADSKAAPPPQKNDSFMSHFLHNLWAANTVTVTVLSIVLAMLIGAVLIVVSDADVLATFSYFTARPSDALTASWTVVSEAYANLFKGAVFDPEAATWQAAVTHYSGRFSTEGSYRDIKSWGWEAVVGRERDPAVVDGLTGLAVVS